ncbi:MAG: peptidase E [Chitinivibrionales bacterium]|nr:peptidase E [Chitinivibrionales bacterium]
MRQGAVAAFSRIDGGALPVCVGAIGQHSNRELDRPGGSRPTQWGCHRRRKGRKVTTGADSTLKVLAIGGGNLRIGETRRIDRRAVELTGKEHPFTVFLPTATGDDEGYCETFRDVYGGELGCDVHVLKLLRDGPGTQAAAELLAAADLVYVGGGNTLRMMKTWRSSGVDRLLLDAAGRGAVMAGVSAGGICWFSYGHSDSLAYTGKPHWSFVRVRGLGLVNALFCPHYHVERREEALQDMVRKRGDTALAADDNTAIEIVGNQWRVYRSRRSGKAYRLTRASGAVHVERLPADHEFRPLAALLSGEPLL